MQITWYLCDESEDDPRAMIGHFVEICKTIGLRENVDKSEMIM